MQGKYRLVTYLPTILYFIILDYTRKMMKITFFRQYSFCEEETSSKVKKKQKEGRRERKEKGEIKEINRENQI